MLSKDGLKPDLKKSRAAIDMPFSETREELQRHMSMINYLGKFHSSCSFTTSNPSGERYRVALAS